MEVNAMPRPKEEVMEYADDEFLTYLEDHLNYIEAYTYRLKMMMTVYREVKDEYGEGLGWIPSKEIIDSVNDLKKNLDAFFFAVLADQRSLISSLIMWRKSKAAKRKKGKKSERKREELDPSVR